MPVLCVMQQIPMENNCADWSVISCSISLWIFTLCRYILSPTLQQYCIYGKRRAIKSSLTIKFLPEMCQNHYRLYINSLSLFFHGMKKINRNLLWRMLVTDSLSRPANVNRRIREKRNLNGLVKLHPQFNGKLQHLNRTQFLKRKTFAKFVHIRKT